MISLSLSNWFSSLHFSESPIFSLSFSLSSKSPCDTLLRYICSDSISHNFCCFVAKFIQTVSGIDTYCDDSNFSKIRIEEDCVSGFPQGFRNIVLIVINKLRFLLKLYFIRILYAFWILIANTINVMLPRQIGS